MGNQRQLNDLNQVGNEAIYEAINAAINEAICNTQISLQYLYACSFSFIDFYLLIIPPRSLSFIYPTFLL